MKQSALVTAVILVNGTGIAIALGLARTVACCYIIKFDIIMLVERFIMCLHYIYIAT